MKILLLDFLLSFLTFPTCAMFEDQHLLSSYELIFVLCILLSSRHKEDKLLSLFRYDGKQNPALNDEKHVTCFDALLLLLGTLPPILMAQQREWKHLDFTNDKHGAQKVNPPTKATQLGSNKHQI